MLPSGHPIRLLSIAILLSLTIQAKAEPNPSSSRITVVLVARMPAWGSVQPPTVQNYF